MPPAPRRGRCWPVKRSWQAGGSQSARGGARRMMAYTPTAVALISTPTPLTGRPLPMLATVSSPRLAVNIPTT
jgi:hypothetical protein